MPTVAFITLGCKVNQAETEAMEGLFKRQGYEVVSADKPADVYVINTCSVTSLGEKKSRQLIRRARRINPAAVIAVTGCYAQLAPEKVAGIEGVKVVIGTQDRRQIVATVEQAASQPEKVVKVGNIMTAAAFEDIPLFSKPGRTRALLKIQEGCTNFCSYCIIPYLRGPLRSRPLSSIITETRKLVTAGFKEIVLTGIHLGAYGRDLSPGIGLTDAVRAVLEAGVDRIRLGSLESIEVPAELIDLMRADRRLCPHLHLPLQAGDDRILQAMNRHYTVDDFRRVIENIGNKVAGSAVSTDIIVGFPGEGEEMFQNTLKFVAENEFVKVHVFPFSRRTGTPAAGYDGQVAEEVKHSRVRLVQLAAERQAEQFRRRFIGQTMPVLFETEKAGIIDGLTGNYLRVYRPGGRQLPGTIGKVKLAKLYQDGLWGE